MAKKEEKDNIIKTKVKKEIKNIDIDKEQAMKEIKSELTAKVKDQITKELIDNIKSDVTTLVKEDVKSELTKELNR